MFLTLAQCFLFYYFVFSSDRSLSSGNTKGKLFNARCLFGRFSMKTAAGSYIDELEGTMSELWLVQRGIYW